jgi:hypothetical protein
MSIQDRAPATITTEFLPKKATETARTTNTETRPAAIGSAKLGRHGLGRLAVHARPARHRPDQQRVFDTIHPGSVRRRSWCQHTVAHEKELIIYRTASGNRKAADSRHRGLHSRRLTFACRL